MLLYVDCSPILDGPRLNASIGCTGLGLVDCSPILDGPRLNASIR